MALENDAPNDIDHDALMQMHHDAMANAGPQEQEQAQAVPPPRQIMRAMGELWKQVEAQDAVEKQSREQELGAINETLAKVNQAIEMLTETIGQLAQEMTAPIEVIRDQSGRMSQVKKGSRTITVKRGADNKVAALH